MGLATLHHKNKLATETSTTDITEILVLDEEVSSIRRHNHQADFPPFEQDYKYRYVECTDHVQARQDCTGCSRHEEQQPDPARHK